MTVLASVDETTLTTLGGMHDVRTDWELARLEALRRE